jgi:surface carbohydrate biosynthesis protein
VNLLFPTQYSVREVDFRILLATRLAEPGRRVFIGHRDALIRLSRILGGGLYVGKDLVKAYRPQERKRYRRMKSHGFHLVHLDEEGGVHPGDRANFEKMLRLRLDPSGFDAHDAVCTWGETQRDFYAALAPNFAGNIHATGHPRFDTLRSPLSGFYADAQEELKQRYGKFVLVCTNFGRANPRNGIGRTFARPGEVFDPDEYGREQYLQEWAHAHRMLSHVVEMVHALCRRHPHQQVVLRYHPSESPVIYQAAFKSLPQVHVVQKDSVHPWILASQAVVHNGCTTGLEAWIAGKPVLHYAPEPDGPAAKRLPALLSEVCRDQASALSFLEKATQGEVEPKIAPKMAQQMFRNLSAPSLESFADVVNAKLEEMGPPLNRTGDGEIRALARAEHFLSKARNAMTRRPGLGLRRDATFVPFSPANIRPRFSQAMKSLDRRVQWKILSPRVMMVEAE